MTALGVQGYTEHPMEQAEFQPLVLELLKTLREDLNQFKADTNRRFDDVDRRFVGIDRRLQEAHEERKEMREDVRMVHSRLDQHIDRLNAVYDERKKVQIEFGKRWMIASVFIAIGASAITSLAQVVL